MKKTVFFRIFVLLQFILHVNVSYAEPHVIDSLKRALELAQADTSKVIIFSKLADRLEDFSEYHDSKKYAEEGIALAKQIKFAYGEGICYNSKGHAYLGLSDIDSAWYCYNRFYEIASTKLKDSLLKAKAMDNIAVVYVHKGDLEKALHYRTRSTAIYQELGEKKLLANGNMWLGNIYKEKKDLTEAIRYYMLAKKYCEELGDESVLPYVLINLSAVYTAIDEHEEAIDYAKQTMALFEKLGSKSGQAITLFRVSYSLMQTNRYEEALENLLLAESIFTSIGDRYFLSLVYNRLALIYSRWEQWDKAEWYYKKAMAYPEETERFPDLVNIYHGLASMYMMKRDYRKSLEYFRKTEQIYNHLNDKTPIRNMYYNYITLFAGLNQPDSVDFYVSKQKAITDTLIRQSTNRAVEDLQAKYDAEKKAKDLALVALEIEKKHLISLITVAVLSILFLISGVVFLVFTNKKQKERALLKQTAADLNRLLMETHMKALNFQLNPHFIFNCVHTVEYLLSEQKTEESIVCLRQFSNLTRLMLESMSKEYIPLEKELQIITFYMDLEKRRSVAPFTYSIDWDASVDIQEINVPPLILQPFIENSIKHGFVPDKKSYEINLYFSIDRDKLICHIRDNGIGYSVSLNEVRQVSGFKKESLGLKLTEDRLSVIRQLYDTPAAHFHIEDIMNKDNQTEGTLVLLSLPYNYAA